MPAFKIAVIPGDGVGVEVAAEGRKVLEICRSFRTTLPTLYLWIHRFQEGGLAALADRSHARHDPNRTPDRVERAIVRLRREVPSRSSYAIVDLLQAKKLRVSPSTVQVILRRHRLPRVRPPAPPKTPARRDSRSSSRGRR